MMNKFKLSVLTIFLLSISLPRIQAQTNVRAYEKWEATQFVAVSGHQPEDYVLADNNWEIMGQRISLVGKLSFKRIA